MASKKKTKKKEDTVVMTILDRPVSFVIIVGSIGRAVTRILKACNFNKAAPKRKKKKS